MAPTWKDLDLPGAPLDPPLSIKRQGFRRKNAMVFDTPGAASSAADFGSPRGSKSGPKLQKIDVEKQHIFDIDFGRVQASFWEGF